MWKLILAAAALGLASLAYADADTDVADEATQDAEVTAEAKDERPNCLKYTGSRIRPRDGCIELPGHAHDREKLRMTGDANTGEALRRIDPSVRIGNR
jgi:hypothetical protein